MSALRLLSPSNRRIVTRYVNKRAHKQFISRDKVARVIKQLRAAEKRNNT